MSEDFNLLTHPSIGTTPGGNMTLPGVLAALVRDQIDDFPALRPHQAPAWHMFLVQLAALAMHAGGCRDCPVEEEEWAALLRGLTPDAADDEPWCLVVADWTRPAFLQPPVPDGVTLANAVPTADALDLLITSRNHDVKQAVARFGDPSDWLFALISLQTGEGYGGAGNHGIARMNGGSSSRPMLSLAPLPAQPEKIVAPRPGAWFRRDLTVLLESRAKALSRWSYLGCPDQGGLGLTWLAPWPEDGQLAFDQLDLWFIEVCRRVRLGVSDGRLTAWKGTSKAPRIAARQVNGVVGDPFAPVHKAEGKGFTLSERDFDYRMLTELLLSGKWDLPLLAEPASSDPENGRSVLVCAALARGNSKTDGFKCRHLPLLGRLSRAMGRRRQDLFELAQAQISEIAVFEKALSFSLALAAAGGESSRMSKDHGPHAAQACERLRQAADALFFENLWDRFDAGDRGREAVAAEEARFTRTLFDQAGRIFRDALASVSCPGLFRFRPPIRAERAFAGILGKAFPDLRSGTVGGKMSDTADSEELYIAKTVELVAKLLPRLTPGERAALRRMDDNGAGCPAFWHLATKGGFLEDRRTAVWMRIVRIMATLFPKGEVSPTQCLHDIRRGLGTALCDGGERGWGAGENPRPFLSEAGLERFLATPDGRRGEALERILRPLATHRAPDRGVNCHEIAALLLFPATDEKLRAIARDYYRRKDSARSTARQEDVPA